MRHSGFLAFCFLVLGFGACGEKGGPSAGAETKPTVPPLPEVVREIPRGAISAWPRVAEAYAKGPEALEALSRQFETSEPVDKDGRWNMILMAEWFGEASAHFDMAKEKETMLAKLQAWEKLAPNRSSPKVAQAEFWMGIGWDIRGGDWAAKVEEKNMREFLRHVEMARTALKGAEGTRSDPSYHHTVLELARAGNLERADFDHAAADAVGLFPLCPHLSSSIFLYLAPRWYGTKGEWEPYMRKMAKSAGEQNADMFYALAVVEAYRDAYNFNGMTAEMLDPVTVDEEMLTRGLGKVARMFPDSTFYAAGEACVRGFRLNDPAGARAALVRAGGVVDLRFWESRAMHDEIATWTKRRLGGQ